MPVKGFVGSFCGNSFGARLKYFENLHNLMNLVVKWDLRGGGCRKKIFYIPGRFTIAERCNMPRSCRDVPEPCGSDLKYSAAVFKKGSIHRTEPMTGSFVLCRDEPRSCRDGNPMEKEKRLSGYSVKSQIFTLFTGIHLIS